MTSIPSNLSRVPNVLTSQFALRGLNRTNLALFDASNKLTTLREINKISDDAVKAATIGVLDERLERNEQIKRNLTHATANLNVLDSALDEATGLSQEAKSIAMNQLSITSSTEERRGQAVVVDQLIKSLLNTSQRQGPAGYLFGGSVTTRAPIAEFLGGYRYTGTGPGLVTDLAVAGNVPITLPAGNAIGAIAARVRGSVDLDPNLAANARLTTLEGARGLGVATGTIEFSASGGPVTRIDLTGADSVGDVQERLNNAIRLYETENSVTVLGPNGVQLASEGFQFDLLTGATLQFSDVDIGTTAADLGLTAPGGMTLTDTANAGLDLGPKLSMDSPVSALAGVTGPLGSFRLNNMGRSAVIDLSSAETIEDIRNLIEGANLGVRVSINAAGNGIDVLNEVAGSQAQAMSIEEVPGQNLTATRLGIRSLGADTLLSDFNFGRGVVINDGTLNPTTGQLDPSLDTDFRITLGDANNTVIDIDLRPTDLTNVGTLLAAINSQAQTQLAAAGLPPTAFSAGLSDGGNGIVLSQDQSFGTMRVGALNGSPAAENLGLLAATYNASTGTITGADKARIRVDNLFSNLIDLRESLLTDDARGISFAGEGLDRLLVGLAEVRGLVGGYAQRVDAATTRIEDRAVVDESVRSELRDLDFTAAATRLQLLQTQQQAGLQVTARLQQLSLLDFLG